MTKISASGGALPAPTDATRGLLDNPENSHLSPKADDPFSVCVAISFVCSLNCEGPLSLCALQGLCTCQKKPLISVFSSDQICQRCGTSKRERRSSTKA